MSVIDPSSYTLLSLLRENPLMLTSFCDYSVYVITMLCFYFSMLSFSSLFLVRPFSQNGHLSL